MQLSENYHIVLTLLCGLVNVSQLMGDHVRLRERERERERRGERGMERERENEIMSIMCSHEGPCAPTIVVPRRMV